MAVARARGGSGRHRAARLWSGHSEQQRQRFYKGQAAGRPIDDLVAVRVVTPPVPLSEFLGPKRGLGLDAEPTLALTWDRGQTVAAVVDEHVIIGQVAAEELAFVKAMCAYAVEVIDGTLPGQLLR